MSARSDTPNPSRDLSHPGLAPLMQALTIEGAPNALAILQTKPADPLSKRERFGDVGPDESRQRADWDEAVSEGQVVRGGLVGESRDVPTNAQGERSMRWTPCGKTKVIVIRYML